MTQPPDNAREQASHVGFNADSEQETGLVDAIRFLYQRRVRLLFYFIVIFAICVIVFLFTWFTSTPTIEGTLGLNFRGIEKSEYPSAKRFSVEDFRGPDLLAKALADAGISTESVSLKDLAANLNIIPVIPAEIQNRWRKQDKDGTRREEYYPNEFRISLALSQIPSAQRLRLFDSVVKRYKERVKYDQKSALAFTASWGSTYEKLANSYDPWDIPELFRESYRLMNSQIAGLISESLQYQDAKYQLAFREISRALDTWDRTRLQALEALTYQGQLVRNREIVAQRIQYRLQELDIRIRQQTQEAAEAMRLLEVIDRPRALLAGQLNNREGLPLVDAGVLERLIKSDYVGPVVQRISTLQQDIQTMEAEKARLQKQFGWLPKSSSAGQTPSGYKNLIDTLSSELTAIINDYNRILEEYLTATITSLVVVKQPPLTSRTRYSPVLILAGITFLSLFLALAFVAMGRLLERVREELHPAGRS